MTSDRVCAPSGEDEENTALDYYDEEDDLEAFSDADLGCEDGGRRTFVLLRKVTRRQGARGDPLAHTTTFSILYTECDHTEYLWKTYCVS